MPVMQTLETGGVPVKIWTDDIQPEAIQQLANAARLPFVVGHVAAMPDVHLGLGATVGSVVATRAAIVPAAVGVDIGCGMMALRTSLSANQLPDNLAPLRSDIEQKVPVGFGSHGHKTARTRAATDLDPGYQWLMERHPKLQPTHKRDSWFLQIGTLGGGNHFIELCLDESQRLWVMLHSGSRGIGNRIGQYFISRARETIAKRGIGLPDRDLAWLDAGSADFEDYMKAVGWAQRYAARNREEMMELVLSAMRRTLPEFSVDRLAINCHHNYIANEEHFGEQVLVTRKGAIRAGRDELGIIPGSMGAKSFIVRGKGNAESMHSCSHGAGRRMSRNQAKASYNLDDLREQTRGVECRKDKGVIDEIPAAYKDIDAVMANQSDLVEVLHTLRQVVCVKG